MMWEIHCPKCGELRRKGKRPKVCPDCGDADIISMYERRDLDDRRAKEKDFAAHGPRTYFLGESNT